MVPRRHGGVALEVIVSWRFHGGFNVGSMGTYWENHWNHVFFFLISGIRIMVIQMLSIG